MALPGQPKADATEDKLQGRGQGAREKEKCQRRGGEEEMGTCWGREEQGAEKAAGREGGKILHDLNAPNSTDPGTHVELSTDGQSPSPPLKLGLS